MASTPEPAEASDDTDDTKRRFREALQRKNAKSVSSSGRAGGPAPQSRAHGPLENRREFRRKSG